MNRPQFGPDVRSHAACYWEELYLERNFRTVQGRYAEITHSKSGQGWIQQDARDQASPAGLGPQSKAIPVPCQVPTRIQPPPPNAKRPSNASQPPICPRRRPGERAHRHWRSPPRPHGVAVHRADPVLEHQPQPDQTPLLAPAGAREPSPPTVARARGQTLGAGRAPLSPITTSPTSVASPSSLRESSPPRVLSACGLCIPQPKTTKKI